MPVVDYEGAIRCVLTLMGQVGKLDIGYSAGTSKRLMETARSISCAAGFAGDIWPPRN